MEEKLTYTKGIKIITKKKTSPKFSGTRVVIGGRGKGAFRNFVWGCFDDFRLAISDWRSEVVFVFVWCQIGGEGWLSERVNMQYAMRKMFLKGILNSEILVGP